MVPWDGARDDTKALRDWFAGQAPDIPTWFERNREYNVPPGTIIDPYSVQSTWVWTETMMEYLTRWRYAYADAMLAERAKQTEARK